MVYKICDIRSFYFWRFEYLLIQASTSACAEQSACMSVPGRCTELNSSVTVLGGTLKWQGMRGMRKKSLQWNSENCFPLFFWPSWAATCTSESRKAPCDLLAEEKLFFLEDCFQDCNSGRECSWERCYLLSEQQSSCIVSWLIRYLCWPELILIRIWIGSLANL